MQSNSKVLHFYNSFKRYTSLCMSVDYTISRNLRDGGIGTRPISSNGLWCCALLPALLISYNFLYKVSPLYTLVAYVAVGLFCYSILFVVFISVSCLVLREPIYGGCIASSLVSALMNFIFNTQGLTTSLSFSLTAVYLYSTMLRWSLTKFPKTYTIGEAMIVTQGLTLFTIAVIGRTMNILHDPNEDMNLISSIVLTALSTVGLLITGLCVISEKQRNIQTFSYMFAVAALFALVTLHVLLGLNCVFRILNYIFLNRNRVQLFAFWLFLLMISVFLVLTRTKSAVKVNTVTRKSFHLLASLVFMSGIIYDVYLTSLAAGIGFGLLILVEALRKLNITPISEALQSAFDVYSDEKDIGSFAMTPIYLYVGLACPLILVPSYEGTTLELLSGVLATGVGDTAASWFGSKYGTKKWTNSEKTVEGTIANVLSQVATVYVLHLFVVHDRHDSSTESSEKECTRSEGSPVYETIKKDYEDPIYSYPEKSFINDKKMSLQYDRLSEKGLSSACSTPITKIRARIKDIGTPGTLHRSDSTEYCSIFSPNRTVNFELNNNINRDQSVERPLSKLSKSFTPQSYKPLHIKVPEYNFDSIRPILKEPTGSERPSYNFDIKNYSLPTTPIARSTKLRRNAWLSGDFNISDRCFEKSKENLLKSMDKEVRSAPETPATSVCSMSEKPYFSEKSSPEEDKNERTPESVDTIRDCFTGLKRIEHPHDFVSSETDETCRERANSWSFKSSSERGPKYKIEDDLLARVNVKPLVAIHERWIYEANRKNSRSMSLPEDKRCQIPAVKPASHCVDTLQKSLPQLNLKKSGTKIYRSCAASPNSNTKNDVQWEQFCQARDAISKNVSFLQKESDRSLVQRRDSSNTSIEEKYERKIDQATDTNGIEDFIRDMIRKEFKHLLHELSDDASTASANRHEDILTKGVIESLNGAEDDKTTKREPIKSFSRVKINGNNKPLLQITFSRSGENSLQVLDNCVNVTVCDTGSPRDAPADDVHLNSLKRCQAFNAIQEARSTEDLYIDDDLSTQMQENFGGRVKLIPLHGSLHEILCEKEDDCCLIKVKQENGCDSIYFRCDNSDTESRDAIDGTQDTVVFKRSISLIEERIQRVPKEKRAPTPILQRKAKPDKARPKSEIFIPIKRESRAMSNSSPSLSARDDKDEVEVNIENAMCYQDSSSDECLKCQDNDDFEFLERKIEEDIANNLSSLACGCLEKISEENLSVFNEDLGDKE